MNITDSKFILSVFFRTHIRKITQFHSEYVNPDARHAREDEVAAHGNGTVMYKWAFKRALRRVNLESIGKRNLRKNTDTQYIYKVARNVRSGTFRKKISKLYNTRLRGFNKRRRGGVSYINLSSEVYHIIPLPHKLVTKVRHVTQGRGGNMGWETGRAEHSRSAKCTCIL